jgi:type IV fimbrial biogenesis protein FimT
MESRGFTLFELIAVLTITAILSISAIPAFFSLIQQYRLRSAGQQLFHLLTSARATAVMRSKQVTVWNSDGDWSSGATLFEDENGNGEQDAGEAILLRMENKKGVQIQGNRWVADYVQFAPDGSAKTANGAFQVGTITACTEDQSTGYQIVLSIGGRLRMVKVDIEEC